MSYYMLLLGVLLPFVIPVFSSPVNSFGSDPRQVVIAQMHEHREYENGELPPEVDTPGWVDPRLNGGRLLDVRLHPPFSHHWEFVNIQGPLRGGSSQRTSWASHSM